jgi:hypothetical protein
MVDNKMCAGVVKDDMMCRIDPNKEEIYLNRKGARPMDFNGKPMAGYVYADGLKTKADMQYWVQACLDFNPFAKASKKPAKKKAK